MNGDAANDIRSGWLHKRSGGLFPRWQLRHAQCKGGTLYLRHQPTSEKCHTIHVVSVCGAWHAHGTCPCVDRWRESIQAQSLYTCQSSVRIAPRFLCHFPRHFCSHTAAAAASLPAARAGELPHGAFPIRTADVALCTRPRYALANLSGWRVLRYICSYR
jgi:hypothetical protein